LVPDYNEYDIFISNGTKENNWNFDYIDLAFLHKATFNYQQDQQLVLMMAGWFYNLRNLQGQM
jgi:hypothetical protein